MVGEVRGPIHCHIEANARFGCNGWWTAEGEEDGERTSERDRETKERLAIVTSSVDEGVSAYLLRVTQGSR